MMTRERKKLTREIVEELKRQERQSDLVGGNSKEYASRDLYDGRGLKCVKCGCRLFFCIKTDRSRNEHAVVRQRKCVNCGAYKWTREEDCG